MKDGKLGKCKVCTKLHTKKYIQDNKEYKLEYDRQHHQKNKNIIHHQHKEYYINNKEKYQQYYKDNKEKITQYSHQYKKNRKKTDPLFKLSHSIRNLILMSFKKQCRGIYKKNERSEQILGCTIGEFIIHIESQFTEGMALENHGRGVGNWNIDHIIPISSATSRDEIIKLGHYSNLQPLWFEDNMKKFNH